MNRPTEIPGGGADVLYVLAMQRIVELQREGRRNRASRGGSTR